MSSHHRTERHGNGKEHVAEISENLREIGQHIQGAAVENYKQVKETAAEYIGKAKDTAAEYLGQAKDTASDYVGQAKDTANEYYEQGKQKAMEWEDSVVKYIRHKPLQSVVLAAGVGFLLSRMWSRR